MVDGVVSTRFGRLRGVEVDGVFAFRGIRYARAPRGELRFRPPLPPEPWAGVLDAEVAGPVAPQPASGFTGGNVPGDSLGHDEDCLSLNVFTTGFSETSRPVMVFIHGGAFVTGSGSQSMYDGTKLARKGAVVVTVNYRLGVLGFLAHPGLAEDGPGCGNWGLMDIIAALRWVHEHAAVFGGDPDRVTLFGESAGAMAICDLMGSRTAPGLFQRAIIESGVTSAIDLEVASHTAERFCNELGGVPLTRAALCKVPVEDLLAAQGLIVQETDGGFGMPFRPAIDGGVLLADPAIEITAGRGLPVDLLVGTNRDEFRFFSFATGAVSPDGPAIEAIIDRYLKAVHLTPELLAADVLRHYAQVRTFRGEPIEPRDLLDAVAGDSISGYRNSAYSTLTSSTDPPPTPTCSTGSLRSPTGLSVPVTDSSCRSSLGPGIIRLSRCSPGPEMTLPGCQNNIQSSWVAFATGGDPSSSLVGNWPRYEPERRATMRFGSSTRLENAPYEEERSFWEQPLGRYGVNGPIEHGALHAVAMLAPDGDQHSGT